ncbi:MAG TPA: lipid-A-disaccharide synthase [Pyrinomonadaceae bacterium]|nr:lipid-A-disaccharide synthase [Pyrinomonadaceae bacterium]
MTRVPLPSHLNLMIIAGEPSGDAHASTLVKALQASARANIEVKVFGATGPLMRAARVESIVQSDNLAILGLLEIGGALPRFWRAYEALKSAALTRKPDAVILVDWPDFNLRIAHALHRRGLKIIYYISPQLWAWRPHRVRNIKRDVDLLLAILPFESEWYRSRGVEHVEFVGHPLAGEVRAHYERDEFCKRYQLDPARPIVSLLPGSRRREVQRILPPMLDAATLISQKDKNVQFVLAIAPSRSAGEIKQIIAQRLDAANLFERVRIIEEETREALAASDAAAIASGTATLEAALLRTPMVIVYKESRVNWHTLGRLITAEHYGLVNLIAGERLVTELMQNELEGERLAAEIISLLEPERNQALRIRLKEVTARLGDGGASLRAARRILEAVAEWKS